MNSRLIVHLGLLGSPHLAEEGGALLTGRAVQRHRLALLALLALSPGRRMTRDKLMARLWPERDTEHARQLLNQAVYVLRRELGEEVLLTDGDALRLNDGIVRADVLEFEDAVAREDYERAVALHRGPLLDGFFLAGAQEFEQWLDMERKRLAGLCASALEALAGAAEHGRDPRAAVGWWKARAALDPYDSRVALRLMQALETSGNRAGAIRHAEIHERMLQEELGIAAPAEVKELAERLRIQPALHMGAEERVENVRGADPRSRAPPHAGQPSASAAAAPNESDVLSRSPAPSPDSAPASRAETRHAPTGSVAAMPRKRRRFARYAGLVVGLGALVFAASRLERESAPPPDAPVPWIAVLPLASHSVDPRDAALADGMTEEIIAILGRNAGLRVMASTTTFALRGRQADVRRLADSLGIPNLLEGGVQRIGSRLRVRVRLVNALDGSTRWSGTYDRELQDVFAVQDEIARAVARELGIRLGAASGGRVARSPTRNIAAYELYLRASDPALLRSDSAARAGMALFQQAVALDPAYAAAHAGLARMHLRLRLDDHQYLPPVERLRLAEEAARTALTLDGSLAEAHAVLGIARMHASDFTAAEARLKRAIALDPAGARYREWLVGLYIWTERPADALAEAARAVEIDPLSPSARAELARALMVNGRCGEALVQLEQINALQPPLLRATSIAAQCLAQQRAWPEAIALLRSRADGAARTQALALLVHALVQAGQREEARRVHATLLARWRQSGTGTFQVAVAYAGLGDLDQAFLFLDRAVDDHTLVPMVSRPLLMEPLLAELRRDPRFEHIRERLGLKRR